MSILEHFKAIEEFRPETVADYVALQLARQSGDLPNLHWHLHLFHNHSIEEVASAFHTACEAASDPGAILECIRSYFHT
jgi:hypothetical protein